MAFNRIVYMLGITLKTPLAIGSGANEQTDKDVIVDANGKPFIPATAITGVLRSYIREKYASDENNLFGYINTDKNTSYAEKESQIMVYDALYQGGEDNFFIANRDMVRLKKKVAVDGAKFDMQAVEPGAKFTGYIELIDTSYRAQIEDALSAMNNGAVRLGSKTSRGYGEVSLDVKVKEIVSTEDWISFDMWDYDWSNADSPEFKESYESKAVIGLKLVGGISIREYTTEVSTEEKTAPDYRQLALHDKNSTPVIPGTSWAGAFRDRYSEFANDDKKVDNLFGFISEDAAKKSVISFAESQLQGGVRKLVTRNSIDRFTGGTKDGALYTEYSYFGGETSLEIVLGKKIEDSDKKILCACLADLHNGFLAVGGLTSVGRGLFEITSINGKSLSEAECEPDKIYDVLINSVFKKADGEV